MRIIPRSLHPVLALFTLLLPALAWSQGMRFTTLDIGQGDAGVLIAPGGCVALFDGGPTGSGTVIKSYLKSLGITHVDMVFVSHLHTDHMGGIDEVDVGTNAVSIAAVYDHGGTYDSVAYTDYASHFSGRRYKVSRGQTFSLCGQVTLTVVAAGGNGIVSTDENAKSVAVKITYGSFKALVGGDLTGTPDVEATTLLDLGELDVYKVHHHGSRTSSNNTFLDVTRPQVSFISVGRDNNYGHPTAECLGRLTARGSAIWQTEDPATNKERGHIQLTTSEGGDSFQVTQGTLSVSYSSRAGGPDVVSPTTPGALVANSVSGTEVLLGWTASTDNLGVTGYRVYRSTNGWGYTLAGTSSTVGFADLGLFAGGVYAYQVTALDAAGNESPPASASVRTPAPRTTLTLTLPNGGESWPVGEVRTITWASQGISTVKLEFTLDDGASWKLIANNVPSTGSYAWSLPNTLSSAARVRVTNTASPLWDYSDKVFSLVVSTPAKVILNEILANEPSSLTAGEFVEVVNAGGTAIDISGWVLLEKTVSRHVFASGTVLEPGKGIAVFGGASGIPAGTPNAVASSTGSLNLVNGGDTVTLKTATSSGATTVDSYTYPAALGAQDGVSMNRSPDLSAAGTFVLHNTLSPLSASPGVRASGSAF